MIRYIEEYILPKHACILCSFAETTSQYGKLQKWMLKVKTNEESVFLTPPQLGLADFLDLALFDDKRKYLTVLAHLKDRYPESKALGDFLESIRLVIPNESVECSKDISFVDRLIGFEN